MSRFGSFDPQRIALVRALPGLGDLLCIIPALRSLRASMPQAQISLVGLPSVRPFVERFPGYVDELLEFPGYPGIPERPCDAGALSAFLTDALSRRFDLAVQMHGSGASSNAFTALLGAQHVAGFYLPGSYCPDERFFLPFVEREPEVRRYLRLMEFLGFPSQGEQLEFPLTDADYEELEAVPEARELRRGQYVCVHPGAKDGARRWPPEQFAMIGDSLARRGLHVVLTGTEKEYAVVDAVARSMRGRATNLAGATRLGALGALVSGARLVVCNDTGVSHLAVALRTPSVVVFTASDPARWAPLDRERHRVASSWAFPGATGPTVQEVLEHTEDLLRKETAYAA